MVCFASRVAYFGQYRKLDFAMNLEHSRAGISTLPAEALLARMQATVDNLCAERDKCVGEQRMKYPGTSKVIKGPQLLR